MVFVVVTSIGGLISEAWITPSAKEADDYAWEYFQAMDRESDDVRVFEIRPDKRGEAPVFLSSKTLEDRTEGRPTPAGRVRWR